MGDTPLFQDMDAQERTFAPQQLPPDDPDHPNTPASRPPDARERRELPLNVASGGTISPTGGVGAPVTPTPSNDADTTEQTRERE